MKNYFVEVVHVDAASNDATDFITEWIDVHAISEDEAFNRISRNFLAIGRVVHAQTVVSTVNL